MQRGVTDAASVRYFDRGRRPHDTQYTIHGGGDCGGIHKSPFGGALMTCMLWLERGRNLQAVEYEGKGILFNWRKILFRMRVK